MAFVGSAIHRHRLRGVDKVYPDFIQHRLNGLDPFLMAWIHLRVSSDLRSGCVASPLADKPLLSSSVIASAISELHSQPAIIIPIDESIQIQKQHIYFCPRLRVHHRSVENPTTHMCAFPSWLPHFFPILALMGTG